jgi:hypothetical protein
MSRQSRELTFPTRRNKEMSQQDVVGAANVLIDSHRENTNLLAPAENREQILRALSVSAVD